MIHNPNLSQLISRRLSFGPAGVSQDFCSRPPSLHLSPARLRNGADVSRNSPMGRDGSESTGPMGGLGGRSSPYASPRRPVSRGGGRGGQQTHYSTLDLGFETSTSGKRYSSNQEGAPRPPLPCRLRRPPPPLRCSSLDRAHYSAPSNNCLVTQRLGPETTKAKLAPETAPLPSPEDPRTPTNPPLPPLPTDSGSCGSSSSSGYSSQAGGVPQPRPPQEDATPHSSMELLPMHPMPIPMPITFISSLHSSMSSNSPLDQLPPPPPSFDPNPLYGNLQ